MNAQKLELVKQITLINPEAVALGTVLYEAEQQGKADEWPYTALWGLIALLEEETDKTLADLDMAPRPKAVRRLG